MIPRPFYHYKEKLLLSFILCTVLVFAIYLYANRVQVDTSEEWSGSGRCISELTSLKYQLNGKFDNFQKPLRLKISRYQ